MSFENPLKTNPFAACLAGMFFASSPVMSAQDAPSGFLCNLLTQPEACVITEPQPDFGWIVPSTRPESKWESKWGQCANLDKMHHFPTLRTCHGACALNSPVPFTT